jgi:hypothetical protein
MYRYLLLYFTLNNFSLKNSFHLKKNFCGKIPFPKTHVKQMSSMDTNFVNEDDIIYEEDLNMEVTILFIFYIILNV